MLQLFVRRLFLCRHPKLFSLFCAAATLTFVLIIRLTTTYDFRLRLRYLPAIDGHTSEHLRKIREAGTGNKIPAKLSIRNPQSLSVKGDRSDTFHWRVADTVSDKGDSKQLALARSRLYTRKYNPSLGLSIQGQTKVDIVKELDLRRKVNTWIESIKYKNKLPLEDFQLGYEGRNVIIDQGNGRMGPRIPGEVNVDLIGQGEEEGIIIPTNPAPLKNPTPLVPRIVHVIWFFTAQKCQFRFHNLISLLSVQKFIKPDRIFFWYSNMPCGKWWQVVKRRVPIISPRYLEAPTMVFGHRVDKVEHRADVARIVIMLRYGGIYIDLDVVAVQSWDPLLYYQTTLGAESPYFLANGVIISVPNAIFLRLWYDGYRTFNDSLWNFHSCFLPMLISKRYPNLLHIERDTFYRPLWNELQWLYKPGYLWDWSINYGVHLWYRFHTVEHNPEDIKTLNTTMAEVFRYILYGSPDVIVL